MTCRDVCQKGAISHKKIKDWILWGAVGQDETLTPLRCLNLDRNISLRLIYALHQP